MFGFGSAFDIAFLSLFVKPKQKCLKWYSSSSEPAMTGSKRPDVLGSPPSYFILLVDGGLPSASCPVRGIDMLGRSGGGVST